MTKAGPAVQSGPYLPGGMAADAFAARMRTTLATIIVLAGIILLLRLSDPPYFVLSSDIYLPLHTAMEVFAIVVSAMVFGLSWHSFDGRTPPAIAVLSSTFFAVGLLDLGHMLAFPGMPVFVTPSSVEKGIDFWLAARAAGAFALLGAAVLPWEATHSTQPRIVSMGAAAAFTGTVFWLILFHPELLPATFMPDRGLTGFKILSEYMLVSVYLLAAILLLRMALQTRSDRAVHLFSAACIMAVSELCFTLYANATDMFNVIGHVYKVLAYVHLYRAIFVEGVYEPFRKLQASQNSLKVSESRFRSLMEFAPDAILLIDRVDRIVMMNARAEEMFGYGREALLGRMANRVMPFSPGSENILKPNQDRGAVSLSFEALCRRHDGALFPAEISLGRLEADEGPRMIAVVRDATERKKAAEEKDRLIAILEATPDFVAFLDAEKRPLYLNRSGRTMLGLSATEPVSERRALEFVPEWAADVLQCEAMPAALRDGYWQGETALRLRDGQEMPVSQVLLCHKDDTGQPAYWSMICRDISERKHFETALLDQVMHDALTGLPNRLLINERLRDLIAHMVGVRRVLAVMFLDIDHFKRVNDTYGHGVGDEVLKQVGHRLQQPLREGDTLARQSGDEFIILLPTLAQSEDAAALAERLLATMREPFIVAGREIFLSASLGISLYPEDHEDGEGLLHAADLAMDSAKDAGRDRFCFYTRDLELAIRERLEMENRLRFAVERDELLLHYQPRVNIATGKPAGVEALVRWQHPELGMIPPARFIPVAEESGLIEQIGLWVFRTACRQVCSWREQGIECARVAVNLSARQFHQATLVQDIRSILDETGADAGWIELEITESTVMKDTESAVRTLRALKQLGVGLSIDDFGTGYSSLSYLKLFPIDVLKIDRSFIMDVTEDPDDAAITRAIIALAHSLELIVVAEGVETRAQAEFLRDCQCDEIQGYYFSRPLPVEEVTALVLSGRTMELSENRGPVSKA